jgi:hypothetical protein
MPDFALLGPLVARLHGEFVQIYYLMLPVFFCLAITLSWFKSPGGSPDFLDALKRAVLSTILLIALPDISKAILFIADGITERIDQVKSLDAIIQIAKEKSQSYSSSTSSILPQFNDLIIATLSFLSFLLLYLARYLTIAMYHFFWIFFMIASPLLLLFNMFRSTSQITANLFRGMCEVASWKIVWAILGAMLSSLSLGDAYRAEGNYLVLIIMNFVIAIAMLATPMMVRSLVGSGLQSMSGTLGTASIAAVAALPAKAAMVSRVSRQVVSASSLRTITGMSRMQPRSSQKKGKL